MLTAKEESIPTQDSVSLRVGGEQNTPPCHIILIMSFILSKERLMITVANRIYVALEYQDEFEERFRNRARLVDGMPGFISNQVLRPVNDGDPYVVFTLWESRKDFENWVESEEFRKGHAQSGTLPKEAFTQSNKLELHEVFLDSARSDLKEEPRGGPFKVH